MRENFPPAAPSATELPPAPGSDAATNSAVFTGPDSDSPDAPGIPGTGAGSLAGGATSGISPARLRQGLLWLFIGLAAIVLGVAATAFVREFRSWQALHAVERAATASVAKQEQAAMPARDPAPLPPAMPMTSVESVTPAGTPAFPMGSQASIEPPMARADPPAPPGMASGSGLDEATANSAANVGEGVGLAGEVASVVPGQKRADQGPQERGTGSPQDSFAATPARSKPEKRESRAGASKRNASSENRAIAKRTARANTTFKRCPPLGREGAVMCRWHICNGAAGKEPACRPYLERRP